MYICIYIYIYCFNRSLRLLRPLLSRGRAEGHTHPKDKVRDKDLYRSV